MHHLIMLLTTKTTTTRTIPVVVVVVVVVLLLRHTPTSPRSPPLDPDPVVPFRRRPVVCLWALGGWVSDIPNQMVLFFSADIVSAAVVVVAPSEQSVVADREPHRKPNADLADEQRAASDQPEPAGDAGRAAVVTCGGGATAAAAAGSSGNGAWRFPAAAAATVA